jgi:hypothetical protein
MLEDSNLQTIAEVLKRFKKAPARLQVTALHSDDVRVSILDSLLVPFTASLTSLVLSRVPISQVNALPSGLFPVLEKLVICVDPTEFHPSTWPIKQPRVIVAFEDAPVLQRVAINNLDIILPGKGTPRLPWHQFTHFLEHDFDTDSDPFLTELLPQCVALQWLHINLIDKNFVQDDFKASWANEPARSIQNLRSLTLNFWGTHSGSFQYPTFLNNFKFPGLCSLRLEGSEMDFDDESLCDQEEVDRFLQKIEHEFRLGYLSICHSPIPRATLERLFKATPHVTTLDAQIHENYVNFFETLTIQDQDSSQYLLPRLQTLVLELGTSAALDDDEGETIEPDDFAVFLESRMRLCAPNDRLRKVVLYGRNPDEVSDAVPFVQVIQPYLAEGLTLERHVVGDLRARKLDDDWMERDPELQDWLEAIAVRRRY